MQSSLSEKRPLSKTRFLHHKCDRRPFFQILVRILFFKEITPKNLQYLHLITYSDLTTRH